ncbi:MAG: DUF721 domain-containing protein [Bacteroidales bacterium]|nr:DUF721 domain-containing protein [Bacteroidales bacterium]
MATTRIHRKEAVGMDKIVEAYIKSMKIAAGLNTQRVFAAWDACSGAASYTLRRFFRGGKLYITLNSSVVRSQLFLQKDLLIEKMNAFLSQDALFTNDNKAVGFIQELILK